MVNITFVLQLWEEEVYEVVNKGKQYCVQAHWLANSGGQSIGVGGKNV